MQSECDALGEADPACPPEARYCIDGSCSPCSLLPEGCAALDPAAPVCDEETGRCVECTAQVPDLCDTSKQACIDHACSPCSDSRQCASGVCLTETSECLLREVALAGIVHDSGTLAGPQAGVTVQATNVGDDASDGPTLGDGAFRFAGIAPGTLVELELSLPQDDPFFIPSTLNTRQSVFLPNEPTVALDTSVVRYAWLAQTAYECGLFASPQEAVGNGSINPYFLVRSTVVGRLTDEQGYGVPLVSRGALQATLGDWINFHGNVTDTDSMPAHVCFLERDLATDRLHGSDREASGPTGDFIMFRVRNGDGNGRGALTVKSPGFDPVVVNLASSGNIARVELRRNDQPITREFATDIYPIFQTHSCQSCHRPGGAAEGAVRNGYDPFFNHDLEPWEVWQNLVGPGVLCEDLAEPLRICVDAPERSLMVAYPLADEGTPDPHIIDIFPSIDDPTVQVILDWIEQGALPPAQVQFSTEIYPLFAKHGCTGCHANGGPEAAVLDGVAADWSLTPYEVWANLVGPGTTCEGAASPRRVCVDDPARSRLVEFPLAGTSGEADAHPNKTFGALSDPDLQRIVQWIAQGAEFEASCEHSVCAPGNPLVPGCSACVTAVCDEDSFCCTTSWDSACVAATEGVAGCEPCG